MKTKILSLAICFVIFIMNSAFAPLANGPIDYLHVPGPLAFNGKLYGLSWTSHPSENFYKHEYIVKGDNAERFKSMLMLDVITGDGNIKDIVAVKTKELEGLKQGNPVIQYETIVNPKTGEYILDFLISENSADGKTINILERNIYRYKYFTANTGQKGIVLLGVSTRAYGNETQNFLRNLKSTRPVLVKAVSEFKVPQFTLLK